MRRLLVALMALLALVPTTAAAQDADADADADEGTTDAQVVEPSLSTSLAGADFGEQVIVSGAQWPPNTFVQVELCGNEGIRATQDCDQVTAEQIGVNTAGTFSAVMLVGNPPEPCPCVFRVSSLSSTVEATLSFEVRGAPIAQGDPEPLDLPQRRLSITDARLTGSGPWLSWLGGAPERTLILTVVNSGETVIEDPSLDLRVGKGGDPSGFVEPPPVGELRPGETVTLEVPIELPTLAVGTYAVEGQFQGFAEQIWFRAETSHVPWLLLLIPLLILVQLALVAVRNRARRSVERQMAESQPVVVAVPMAPPTEEVIDLREPQPVEAEAYGTMSVFDPPGADPDEVHEVLAGAAVADPSDAPEPESLDGEASEPGIDAVPLPVIDLRDDAAEAETVPDTPVDVADMAQVAAAVEQELDAAFDRLIAGSDGLDEASLLGESDREAFAAADRIAARVGIADDEKAEMAERMSAALRSGAASILAER